jgi:VanZ family protein
MTNRKFSSAIIYWLPAIGYMGLIFFLSSLPSHELKISKEIPDYILHVIEYFLCCIFLLLGYAKGIKEHFTKKAYFIAVIISTLYALSDEFHQSFVPTRDANIRDIAADIIGSLLAAGIIYLFIHRKKFFLKVI